MKSFLIILVFLTSYLFSYGQIANIITNENYFNDAKSYLASIDTNVINTNILIDRTIYDSIILNINGYDAVTSINSGHWYSIIRSLRQASFSPDKIPERDAIINIRDNYYYSELGRVRPISIINYNFNRIKQESLDNEVFIETGNKLLINEADTSSFTTHRAFAASCLSYNIMGNDILFIVPKELFFTNNTEETIKSIEIDFGNGQGFMPVNFDEIITVSYPSVEDYFEVIIKILFENTFTLKKSFSYAHFSFFKTKSTLSYDIFRNQTYFPSVYDHVITFPSASISVNLGIYYTILLNADNESNKLRRPFVMCDGFDPGNKRRVWETVIDDDALPKDKDFRGMYDILNGDPSPWEAEASANLVQSLLEHGYDLVFIDFNWGAGPIQDNAVTLRKFLNEKINSAYRDNKTEELVFIGPSMGGLISRLAFTTMEQNNEQHYVKTWMSFDSPQKGAYIPLGLQWFLKHFETSSDGCEEAIKKLNADAARQMLLYHYTNPNDDYKDDEPFEPGPYKNGSGLQNFIGFYNYLESFGYPITSLNYGITSGGKNKLYNNDDAQIVNFKSTVSAKWGKAWSCKTSTAKHKIYEGKHWYVAKREKFTKTHSLSYENAPGGYNTALYTINFDKNNKDKPNETDVKYNKATFMPTTTAFGIGLNANTVHNTWEVYTNRNDIASGKTRTPFDKIHGNQTNEEHCNVSIALRNYIIEEHRQDFKNSIRPRVKLETPPYITHKIINQKVDGKVAYVAKETFAFGGGGNDNTFTLEAGADVNIRAGQQIRFLPGFTAVAGSNLHAKIDPSIDYPDVLKSSVTTPELVTASPINAYVSIVHDYSAGTSIEKYNDDFTLVDEQVYDKDRNPHLTTEFKISLHPNPARDEIFLNISGIEKDGTILIEIYNHLGILFYQTSMSGNGFHKLDIEKLFSGQYFLKANYNNKYLIIKFISL